MKDQDIRFTGDTSKAEDKLRTDVVGLFRRCPIPDNELMSNLELFVKRQSLTRILFMNELYKRILNVHGVVMEFGVRWGRNLALFESLRGIYEPFNHNRKIIGFDTFEGFPLVHDKDGANEIVTEGAYAVTGKYEEYLAAVLDYHEKESPISHIKKYELRKGDATQTVPQYLEEHPETIVAFAYFDMDLYEPTKKVLEAIRPHLTKGCVLGFDELNLQAFPGETIALKEVLGLDRFRIQRSPLSSVQSFLIIE